MTRPTLTITIKGNRNHIGSTSIAVAIAKFLEDHGFEIDQLVTRDNESEEMINEFSKDYQQRMKLISDKVNPVIRITELEPIPISIK